jgi:hypothetical protein
MADGAVDAEIGSLMVCSGDLAMADEIRACGRDRRQ